MTGNRQFRVPAEWEPHAATWMQWPSRYEASMRPAFANIIAVIQAYEPVHVLVRNKREKISAEKLLTSHGVNLDHITWHSVAINNAWLRDNGPIYLTDGNRTWIQNWKFDAWGGNFGDDVEYRNDDRIPAYIAKYLGLSHEDINDYVMEKGNLEFNGEDTLCHQ